MGKKNVDLEKCAAEYLWHCRYEKRLSEGSVRAYEFDLEAFNKFAAKKNICDKGTDINRMVIRNYIAELNTQFKVKTVKRKIACLRGFFSYMEEEGIVRENPFDRLKIHLKEPIVYPEVMSLDEIKRILETAYKCPSGASTKADSSILDFLHLRDVAVLEFLFATGLRVHELCNLTFEDCDEMTHMLKILGKGQKERHLFVGNGEVLKAMKSYEEYRYEMGFEDNHVFLNKWGDKLSCQAVRNIVTKYCHLAGIRKNITPHAFRHTFATLLLEEGVDIKYIQEFLGHSSISTTQIYLHVSEKNAREVLYHKHPRERLHMKVSVK